jgi:hypothetical protein
MASSTLLTPSSDRSRFKLVLWISLGLTALFVFVTSEALLVCDYPMYHAYRLQVIADRHLLIPHTLFSLIALLAGPMQFSSRLRQHHPKFHRVLGRIYVISVFIGALSGVALAAGRPGLPGTSMQGEFSATLPREVESGRRQGYFGFLPAGLTLRNSLSHL